MKTYALIGYPLGHSFSQRWFGEFFGRSGLSDTHRYTAVELPVFPASKDDLLAALPEGIAGFNVTIPYKRDILALLDTISPEADVIGAVNCVKVSPYGTLTGYNTDAYGFELALLGMLGATRPRDALVLGGSGGAAAAVNYALDRLGIAATPVSRRTGVGNTLTYADITAEVVKRYGLIVNCTPVGTFPHADQRPPLSDTAYEAVGPGHFLFDLVYNPPLTRFLCEGLQRGACVKNGSEMLVRQAERSWEIWNRLG